jgi:hypothetical protein
MLAAVTMFLASAIAKYLMRPGMQTGDGNRLQRPPAPAI